jgi:hypothetical protein
VRVNGQSAAPNADLLKDTVGFAAERLTAPEAGLRAGAACGEEDSDRNAQPNRWRIDRVCKANSIFRSRGGRS